MQTLLFRQYKKGGASVDTVEAPQENTIGTMELAPGAMPRARTLHRAFQQQATILLPRAARGNCSAEPALNDPTPLMVFPGKPRSQFVLRTKIEGRAGSRGAKYRARGKISSIFCRRPEFLCYLCTSGPFWMEHQEGRGRGSSACRLSGQD